VPDDEVRKQLLAALNGGQAHITFDDAVRDFPVGKAGIRPPGSRHSAWELLEHLRIALEDISRFSGVLEETQRTSGDKHLPSGYAELKWPDDYWPKSPTPPDEQEWHRSVEAVRKEMAAFARRVEDRAHDLLTPFPWGSGQNLLREALLIANHNSYHIGQLMLVRRMLE
jgi:hypothetical protein